MEDQQASTTEGEEAGTAGSDVENQTPEEQIAERDIALEAEQTDPEDDKEAPAEQVVLESEGGHGEDERADAEEGEDSDSEMIEVSVEESAPEAERSEQVEEEMLENEPSERSSSGEESALESAEATLEDGGEQVASETDGAEETALEIETDESTEAVAEDSEQETELEAEARIADSAATQEETEEPIGSTVEELELDAEAPVPEPEAEATAELEEDLLTEAEIAPNGNEGQAPTIAEELAAEVEAEVPEGKIAEPDDGREWYVVHCYSGYENKVRHNLEQRIETMDMKGKIFDVVVPTEEEMEVRDGKRRTVERRVFPGYILVQMIMDEDSWYVVRNTPGVTGFVGMGNEPTALRPEEVSQIVKRMEADAPRIKVTYNVGQKVRIIDGPFNDFIGTVDDIDMDKAKVRVMVSFFGRETPVELDFLQVDKA